MPWENDHPQVEPVYAALAGAIAAALANGGHRDHALLLLHERLRAPEEPSSRRALLRSLVTTPAHTPLGIAAKLAVACDLYGHFKAAQTAPDGAGESHVIVSVLMDSLAQSRLLPLERPAARH